MAEELLMSSAITPLKTPYTNSMCSRNVKWDSCYQPSDNQGFVVAQITAEIAD